MSAAVRAAGSPAPSDPQNAEVGELYIGLMSGTSLDAVDGVLAAFDSTPDLQVRTLAFASEPIPDALRDELLALQQSGRDELRRAALAARALSRVYARVASGLHDALPSERRVRAIGAHGQTVRHVPQDGYTLQLIDGALLAELAGCDTVVDFRSADVAAGGQGAPLAPAFHAQVFGSPAQVRAVLNLGGIANVTVLRPDAAPLGHDTGPANVLLDLWCRQHLGTPFDRDGAWARSGKVVPSLLARMRAEPYFALTAPKSTGRDLFHEDWLRAHGVDDHTPADVQATLLELTAVTTAEACREAGVASVYVCGGGARNAALMARLRQLLGARRVESTQALGIDPQAVEALAFAWLARERIAGRPANLPSVTGARGARILGAWYPGAPDA